MLPDKRTVVTLIFNDFCDLCHVKPLSAPNELFSALHSTVNKYYTTNFWKLQGFIINTLKIHQKLSLNCAKTYIFSVFSASNNSFGAIFYKTRGNLCIISILWSSIQCAYRLRVMEAFLCPKISAITFTSIPHSIARIANV